LGQSGLIVFKPKSKRLWISFRVHHRQDVHIFIIKSIDDYKWKAIQDGLMKSPHVRGVQEWPLSDPLK
jgi:hypothetical protein